MLGLDLLAIAGEFNRVTPDISANSTAIAVLSHQPGAAARALHGPAHPPRPQRHPGGRDVEQRRGAAGAGGDLQRARFRQAGADRAGHDQPRRRRHQAHRLRRRLSLSGAADRSAGDAQPAADGGERRRIRAAAGEQVRRAGGVRHRLRRRRAGDAALGDLDRARLRQQPRLADPAADRRGAGDLRRQPRRPRARRAARWATSACSPTTFNTMASQVKSQRDELLDANEKMDQRRRFTEAVLSGVSAGVIGLDGEGVVTLVNRSALEALGENGSGPRRPAARRGDPGARRRPGGGAPALPRAVARADPDQPRRRPAHAQRPGHAGARRAAGSKASSSRSTTSPT